MANDIDFIKSIRLINKDLSCGASDRNYEIR